MWRSYIFEVAALNCQYPLQAAPEPGTGFLNQRLPGDDTKDHDGGGKLGLHDPGDVRVVHGYPPVVLLVENLILGKVLFIRKEPNHPSLFWFLELVQQPVALEDPPCLGCFGQKLTCLHPVGPALQVLNDTLVDSPFGGV